MTQDHQPEENTGIIISDHSKLLTIYNHESVRRGLEILAEIAPEAQAFPPLDEVSLLEVKPEQLEQVTEEKIHKLVTQYQVLWNVQKIAANVFCHPIKEFVLQELNRWEKSKLISNNTVILYCILSYFWIIDRHSWSFSRGYWSSSRLEKFVKHIFVRLSSLLEEEPEKLIMMLIELENRGFDIRK